MQSWTRREISFFIVSKVVDGDIHNFKDFVDEIADKYPPRYKGAVNVAYYDDTSQNHIEIKSDLDLLGMFAKHLDTKEVNMAIAYTLPTEIPEWPTAPKKLTDDIFSMHPIHAFCICTRCKSVHSSYI